MLDGGWGMIKMTMTTTMADDDGGDDVSDAESHVYNKYRALAPKCLGNQQQLPF